MAEVRTSGTISPQPPPEQPRRGGLFGVAQYLGRGISRLFPSRRQETQDLGHTPSGDQAKDVELVAMAALPEPREGPGAEIGDRKVTREVARGEPPAVRGYKWVAERVSDLGMRFVIWLGERLSPEHEWKGGSPRNEARSATRVIAEERKQKEAELEKIATSVRDALIPDGKPPTPKSISKALAILRREKVSPEKAKEILESVGITSREQLEKIMAEDQSAMQSKWQDTDKAIDTQQREIDGPETQEETEAKITSLEEKIQERKWPRTISDLNETILELQAQHTITPKERPALAAKITELDTEARKSLTQLQNLRKKEALFKAKTALREIGAKFQSETDLHNAVDLVKFDLYAAVADYEDAVAGTNPLQTLFDEMMAADARTGELRDYSALIDQIFPPTSTQTSQDVSALTTNWPATPGGQVEILNKLFDHQVPIDSIRQVLTEHGINSEQELLRALTGAHPSLAFSRLREIFPRRITEDAEGITTYKDVDGSRVPKGKVGGWKQAENPTERFIILEPMLSLGENLSDTTIKLFLRSVGIGSKARYDEIVGITPMDTLASQRLARILKEMDTEMAQKEISASPYSYGPKEEDKTAKDLADTKRMWNTNSSGERTMALRTLIATYREKGMVLIVDFLKSLEPPITTSRELRNVLGDNFFLLKIQMERIGKTVEDLFGEAPTPISAKPPEVAEISAKETTPRKTDLPAELAHEWEESNDKGVTLSNFVEKYGRRSIPILRDFLINQNILSQEALQDLFKDKEGDLRVLKESMSKAGRINPEAFFAELNVTEKWNAGQKLDAIYNLFMITNNDDSVIDFLISKGIRSKEDLETQLGPNGLETLQGALKDKIDFDVLFLELQFATRPPTKEPPPKPARLPAPPPPATPPRPETPGPARPPHGPPPRRPPPATPPRRPPPATSPSLPPSRPPPAAPREKDDD